MTLDKRNTNSSAKNVLLFTFYCEVFTNNDKILFSSTLNSLYFIFIKYKEAHSRE